MLNTNGFAGRFLLLAATIFLITGCGTTAGNGGGGNVSPVWFTWWGGDSAYQVASANIIMWDQTAPRDGKSAGLIEVASLPGPQNDPDYLTQHLNTRRDQGFLKIFMEVERGLSRNEIRSLKSWAEAHPEITIFVWQMSYDWIHAYGDEPAEQIFDAAGRPYCYWDEWQGSPANLIFCWQVYFSWKGAGIVSDFTNDVQTAAEERNWVENHYLTYLNSFGLKNQSLLVICLGGSKSQNPDFNQEDLIREMNLARELLPLGLGFFGTSDGWSITGGVAAADTFCQQWLNQ